MTHPKRTASNGPKSQPVLFSTSRDYVDAARYQLRIAFPEADIEQVAPDAGLVVGSDVAVNDLAEACRSNRVIFVRHLARIEATVEIDGGVLPLEDVVDAATEILSQRFVQRDGSPISLQLWTSGYEPSSVDQRPDLVRKDLASRLGAAGWSIRRSGTRWVLSVLLTKDRVFLGFNQASEALVDWPGGRVGLAKSPDRISRSEFKLEELFQTFDLNLPAQGSALDLGASPGGWTRVMRGRGFRVTAVDPALLDPRIADDAYVEHVMATAGWYLPRADARFDVVLDDMRMPADLSVETVLRAKRLLKSNGTLIMTLKLVGSGSGKWAAETAEHSLRQLATAYEILFARQLFHNRHEVTVVARRHDCSHPSLPDVSLSISGEGSKLQDDRLDSTSSYLVPTHK